MVHECFQAIGDLFTKSELPKVDVSPKFYSVLQKSRKDVLDILHPKFNELLSIFKRLPDNLRPACISVLIQLCSFVSFKPF